MARSRALAIVLAIAIPLFMYSGVKASSGDRLPSFQHCLRTLLQETPPAPLLRNTWAEDLTRWTPLDQAKYHCMMQESHHAHHRQTIASSRVHQFYGKWPFHRFAGCQEPASVFFSLLNLWAHARYIVPLWRLRQSTSTNAPLHSRLPSDIPIFYVGAALFGVNTWVWSTLFHTRDLPWTEKMDYFSAAAGILYAVYYTIVRQVCLQRVRARGWLALVFVALFTGHVMYLISGERFDYQYNMLFNVTAGGLFNVLWIAWGITQLRAPHRRPHAWRPIVWALSISAAMGLELFDFPPVWGVFDAHSLWHLATIPLIGWWYRFLIIDTHWETQTRRINKERDA